ncbi:MAG: CheR family methyltransferase [Alphaproteobacteria bacterium]
MNIADFDIYQELLKEKSGLVLTQDKAYLLDSRLSPVARKWGFDNIAAMTQVLRGVPQRDLINDIIEAMTTNETSFFRDTKPFDIFKNIVMPYYKNSAPRTIRIWCAAASSGQEPYSLAMTIKEEEAKMPGFRFEILATDISHEILQQAEEGIYTQFEVQRGLPITHLMKYFTQNGDKWSINQDIKNMVKFKYFNLLDPMSLLGTFDVIFCRNVLIYFDQQTKKDIMERQNTIMASDGFYFLGGAETVIGITDCLKTVPDSRGLYAKSESEHIKAA